MKFMVLVKASKESEAGQMPSDKELQEMGAFNEQLIKAGMMLAGDGLHPSSKGVRIRYDGKDRKVTDGPFPETKELLAGYWIIQAKSKEEVIEWMKRAPFDGGSEIEVRQVFDPADFTDMSAETRARFDKMDADVKAQQAKS